MQHATILQITFQVALIEYTNSKCESKRLKIKLLISDFDDETIFQVCNSLHASLLNSNVNFNTTKTLISSRLTLLIITYRMVYKYGLIRV